MTFWAILKSIIFEVKIALAILRNSWRKIGLLLRLASGHTSTKVRQNVFYSLFTYFLLPPTSLSPVFLFTKEMATAACKCVTLSTLHQLGSS